MRYYLRVFFSFYLKNKSIALLALVGLSLGLFGMFILSLKFINETSYNMDTLEGKQIYRVITTNPGGFKQPLAPFSFGEMVLRQSPYVSTYSRYIKLPGHIGRLYGLSGIREIIEDEVYAADSSFIDILNIKNLIASRALELKPGHLLLAKSNALKYFGSHDVVGESFIFKLKDKQHVFVVSGVYEDVAWNNTFRPGFICDLSFYIDVLIQEYGYSRDELLTSYTSDDVGYLIKRGGNTSESNFVWSFNQLTHNFYQEKRPTASALLQRYEDIFHYSASVKNDFIEKGDVQNLKYYRISVLVLFLITAFNYILLQTNLTAKRHLEIGIRKVHGANQISLAKQFIAEALLLAFLTIPLIALYYLLYSTFLDGYLLPQVLVHKDKLWEYFLWLGLLLIGIIAVSMVYLSVYVSALKPVAAIYGSQRQNPNRKIGLFAIVGMQFFVTLVLLTFALNIYRQLNYGFSLHSSEKSDNILLIYFDSNIDDSDYEALKTTLTSHSMVNSMTGGLVLPPSNSSSWRDFIPDNDLNKSVVCEIYHVNDGFFETYGLSVDGEVLQYSGGLYQIHSVVINRKAVEAFGFANPLDERIEGRRVAGVVEDFHFHSLHMGIMPIILYPNEQITRILAIRLNDKASSAASAVIREIISSVFPGRLFSLRTFNDEIRELYAREIALRNFIILFTVIMAIIALTGLTGITLHYLNLTRHSLSIKRVFGASSTTIVKDFSMYFVLMIFIAIAVSIPFSIELTSRFNASFTYSVPFSYLLVTFVSAIMLSFIILICYQVLRKTLNNSPMKYLSGTR